MTELQDDLDRWDEWVEPPAVLKFMEPIVEAACLVANPLDELWFCESHGYKIDVFDGLTPKDCLYVGRTGPCQPIAALIVKKPLTRGGTE